jgi:ketosteroid isomerase-like protein
MTTPNDDHRAILALVEQMHEALHAKDAEMALSCLSDDAVVYDLAPPLRTQPHRDGGGADLNEWFATWQGPIVIEDVETHVEASETIGYTRALRHMTGTKTDGEKVDLWFRSTMGARRGADGWRVTHIHDSVPFAMDGSGRALLDLKP